MVQTGEQSPAPVRLRLQWIAVLALAIAVLLPVAPSQSQAWGLPLSNPIEIAAAAICVIGFVLRLPKSTIVRVLLLAVVTVGALAALLKVVSWTQPPAAFTSCIQVNSPRASDTSRAGPCEKSYDAPAATDSTRLDRVIDFGFAAGTAEPSTGIRGTNWDISAYNALPYNYLTRAMADQYGYPFEIDQNRLPLAVTWTGVLTGSGPTTITYIGEGEVRAGLRLLPLPASYAAPATVTFDRQAGMTLRLAFRWQPQTLAEGPFAAIALRNADGGPVHALPVSLPVADAPQAGSPSPVAEYLPAIITGLLAVGLISLILLIGVALAGMRPTRRLGRWWIPTCAVLILGWIASLLGVGAHALTVPLLPVFVLLLLSLVRLAFNQHDTRVLAWLAISLTAILGCVLFVSRSGNLFYRPTGNDFFTYEGQARTILVTGSAQGGEDIFVYSGAMRYWLYLHHLLFGDGDMGIFILSIILLLGASWFAVRRLAVEPIAEPPTPPSSVSRPAFAACTLGIACVGLMIGTPFMWQGGFVLLSEYPTWVFLAVAFTLILTRRQPRDDVIIGALLGLTILFRGNQLVGVAALLALAWLRSAWPAVRARTWPGAAWTSCRLLAPFIVIGSLAGWHNLVYGGRFIPLATSVPIPVNFPLPPERLLQLGADPAVAQTLVSQLEGVLVLTSPLELMEYGHFTALIRVIQVSLLVAFIAGLLHRFRGPWRSCLLAVLPVAFLVPHVFVQVYVYYPRHVIAGYFIGALVLLALSGRWYGSGRRIDQLPAPATGVSHA